MASSTASIISGQSAEERAAVPLLKQPGPRVFFAGLLFVSLSTFSTRRALIRRKSPVAQMPAQARAQFNNSIKAAERAQGPTAAPKHATTPPPNSAPAPGPGRPNAFQTKGQTSQAGHAGQAPGYAAKTAAEAQAAAEAAAPELHNSGAVLALEALALATINVFSWGMVSVGSMLWYLDIRSLDELRRMVRGGMGADGTGRSEQEVEEEMEEWIASVLSRKEKKDVDREEKLRGKILVTDAKGRVRAVDEKDLLDPEEPKKKTGWLW